MDLCRIGQCEFLLRHHAGLELGAAGLVDGCGICGFKRRVGAGTAGCEREGSKANLTESLHGGLLVNAVLLVSQFCVAWDDTQKPDCRAYVLPSLSVAFMLFSFLHPITFFKV